MASASGHRRRPRHDPKDTEREILDAAERLMRERPFREVTVDEVMRHTGLKRPAFYAHFRDRQDLVLRITQLIGAELFEMTDRRLAAWLRRAVRRADLGRVPRARPGRDAELDRRQQRRQCGS